MTDAIISSISPQAICELLQRRGFRASILEGSDGPIVESATEGLTFQVRFRSVPTSDGTWSDWTNVLVVRLDTQIDSGFVDTWNRTWRYGRLSISENHLLLAMDVSIAGGVTEEHIRVQNQVWDKLVRKLAAELRHAIASDAA